MQKNHERVQIALDRYLARRDVWVEELGQSDKWTRERNMDEAALVLAQEVQHLLAVGEGK